MSAALKNSKRRLAMAMIVVALWAAPAFAQSCAMCYNNAKATPKQAQQTINRAIFVLLIPPISIMTAGVMLAFRYGKRRDLEQNSGGDGASN
jgi:hypothetical protein